MYRYQELENTLNDINTLKTVYSASRKFSQKLCAKRVEKYTKNCFEMLWHYHTRQFYKQSTFEATFASTFAGEKQNKVCNHCWRNWA